MSVRLYGRDVGNGSLAVVTRGFREVLQRAELLEGLVALDKMGGSEEDEPPPGALARDAVFTGNLNGTGVMLRGARHERHWVQVTPNSTFVPKELLGPILKLTNPRILSCSLWGTQIIADVLVEMGCTLVALEASASGRGMVQGKNPDGALFEIHTVRHGVSGFAPVREEIHKTREDHSRGAFRVVHFSTTDGQRKGTLELIQAWQQVQLGKDAKLFLVLDYHARAQLQARMVAEDLPLPSSVVMVPRADIDAERMSGLLCHMHLVACPSRGEGFGLLPLQARACGVPVVATLTTGHSAGHVQGGGVVSIDQSPEMVPIDDGPAALAQAVRPEDIAAALREAHLGWRTLSQLALAEAPAVIEEWSWHRQLTPLLEHLR